MFYSLCLFVCLRYFTILRRIQLAWGLAHVSVPFPLTHLTNPQTGCQLRLAPRPPHPRAAGGQPCTPNNSQHCRDAEDGWLSARPPRAGPESSEAEPPEPSPLPGRKVSDKRTISSDTLLYLDSQNPQPLQVLHGNSDHALGWLLQGLVIIFV